MDHIVLAKIMEHSESLKRMSDLTEEQIVEIFKNGSDKEVSMAYLEKIYNTEYVPCLPTWCTMIFRFRQDCKSAARLYYGGCDISNQTRFGQYFFKDAWFSSYTAFGDRHLLDQIIGFFAWLKNSWSTCLLAINFSISQDDASLQIWKDNEIKYFFQLPEEHQEMFIDRYNENVVDGYNAFIKN